MANKLGNVRTAGFASKREAKRYHYLRLLERAGEISELKCQVRYEVIPKTDKFRAVHYVADFTYRNGFGDLVVEDAKGFKTYHFKLKQKLMYHVHGIEVICV